ncbi:MAG: PspA/IM30 family protein [Prochloraceae cyanobacterium]|nr:PspA/IM30 family protein [Prochloraceae cyanobacterium]
MGLLDMQEQLVKLRQTVATAIAEQKLTEREYNKNLAEANKWQQRSQLARDKGDENLAREALIRQKKYADAANTLKVQLDTQTNQVRTLKSNLIALEEQISEAKRNLDDRS